MWKRIDVLAAAVLSEIAQQSEDGGNATERCVNEYQEEPDKSDQMQESCGDELQNFHHTNCISAWM